MKKKPTTIGRPFIIANWRSHENFVTVLYYLSSAQILRIKITRIHEWIYVLLAECARNFLSFVDREHKSYNAISLHVIFE